MREMGANAMLKLRTRHMLGSFKAALNVLIADAASLGSEALTIWIRDS
jgi:hypothetical protein